MKKIVETVLSQANSVAALTKKIENNGVGGRVRNGGDGSHPAVNKDKHKCEKCKKMVWQKEADFPEYERNNHKRWVGWESTMK